MTHGNNRIAAGQRSRLFPHPFPARFDLRLAEEIVASARKQALVLDPMAGSGTTLLAAINSGREAIGIDIDPLAVQISRSTVSAVKAEATIAAADQVAERARQLLASPSSFEWAQNLASDEEVGFVNYWFPKESCRQLDALARSIEETPASPETSRAGATRFTLRISDLDPLVVTELIDAAEAQERRLLEVVDWLDHEWQKANKQTASTIVDALERPDTSAVPYTLEDIIRTIDQWAFVGKPSGSQKPASGADLHSYLALKGKLGSLRRTGAFDAPNVPPIKASELIQTGRVSVFDVSYANDRLKNLVIAQLLRSVFDYKRTNEKAPHAMLMIEEAHTFISAERSGRMQETIELLREIARRGRKRWLGLTFISQQPSHLPNEMFELCNTRIVHNVRSRGNLQTLRTTAGDVSDEIWDLVPSLGVGQAVVSTPQYRDPLVVNVRPAKSLRQFTD
ncbi:MAG: helicase HerA-like domain-containing protein [Dehalococcoidia bacterium]|jgi:hypothetical protein